ncbi:hypothetical protein CRUP_032897 [Coryphaenoides rupestris]|nr:hypothetical protein CRUP_032897 [Coryphaenoides rupestris]
MRWLVLWSSSVWNTSSLSRRSAFRKPFTVSTFWMVRLPAFRPCCSASSSRSVRWAARSCSCRSSSHSRRSLYTLNLPWRVTQVLRRSPFAVRGGEACAEEEDGGPSARPLASASRLDCRDSTARAWFFLERHHQTHGWTAGTPRRARGSSWSATTRHTLVDAAAALAKLVHQLLDLLWERLSFWLPSSSSCSSSFFWLHSAAILSKTRCFLSSAAATALDWSMVRSSTSPCSLCFTLSRLAARAWADSAASSASCRRTLLGAVDGVRLVLAPPGGDVGVELGDKPLQLPPALRLLLQLLLLQRQVVTRVRQPHAGGTAALQDDMEGRGLAQQGVKCLQPARPALPCDSVCFCGGPAAAPSDCSTPSSQLPHAAAAVSREAHLGHGGSARLFQPIAEVLQVTAEARSLFSCASVAALPSRSRILPSSSAAFSSAALSSIFWNSILISPPRRRAWNMKLDTVWKEEPFFCFLLAAAPSSSLKSVASRGSEDFWNRPITVSFRGSLFFSSQLPISKSASGPFLPPLGFRKLADFPSAALKVASVALGNTHCSSRMEKMPIGWVVVVVGVVVGISKPAMSSTPMKNCLCILVSRVRLMRPTIHLNMRSYTALASAPMEYTHWSWF